MDVLVTGAGGYLGGHVVRALTEAGHEPRALVRREDQVSALEAMGARVFMGGLFDEQSLHRAARGADGLIHCAARMGYWSKQDAEQRRVNVDGTAAVLRVAHRRAVARVVHVSSIVAVGMRRDRTPMTEDEPWVGLARPKAMYVSSKREGEERALAAARSGLPLTVVNPGALFGPRADGRTRGGLVAGILRGDRGRVQPGGSTVADVRDVAVGCVLALEKGAVGRRYLLGDTNVSWCEFATAIASRAGLPFPKGEYPPALGAVLARGAGVLDALGLSRPPWAPERYRFWGWTTYADNSRAREELGYAPGGLEALVERVAARADCV
jgi:dihydroflavonol-4-reductase